MKRPLLWISSFFVLMLFSACAHRHTVTIEPQVFVKQANTGSFKKLYLKTVDLRKDRNIYHRENAIKTSEVTIVPDSNLAETIRDKVKEGLSHRGFRVLTVDQGLPLILQVEILQTKFKIFGDKDGFHQQMNTAFRVKSRNQGKAFSRVYQAQAHVDQTVPFGKFLNVELINQGISKALQKMFDDPELTRFLTE